MPNPAGSVRLGADKIARLTTVWPATLNLKRASRYFDVRVFDHDEGEHLEHTAVSHVVLHDGGVYLNGQPVANPTFGRNFVRFAHKTASGYTSGVLNFTPDGLAFTGKLFVGTNERDVQSHDIAGATPPTVYKTRIAKTGAVPSGSKKFPDWAPPEPADTDAGQWMDGLNLIVGYKFSEAGNLPEPVLQLVNPALQQPPADISESCALTVDPKNQNLILTLVFDDPSLVGLAVDQYGEQFPGGFIVEMAWDGATFRGEMQRFDAAKGETQTTQFAWHGTAEPVTAAKAVPAKLAAAAIQPAASLAIDLNVAELYSLQPDAKTLQDNQFNMLIQNMKWALANNNPTKDWVSTYFAEEPPKGFSTERTDLIKKDLSFYTDRFAIVYLGSSFNKMTGIGAPTTKLTDSQSLNLDFYMRAGLAVEKGYNTQSHGVFLQAFIESLPRLQDYIRDQDAKDPAHDWATQLYNQVTTPMLINQAVLTVIAGHGMEDVNRHSTVLLALEPSGKLAEKYHTLITNASMSRALEHLKLDDKEAMRAWLTDSIQGFIDALLQGKLKVEGMDPDTQARLIGQAEELQKAAEAAGSAANLAAALTDLAVAAGGKDFWEKLANAQTFWGKAGYRFANMIYGLAIVGGLSQAVISFMDWDKLTGEEKATVIVSVVQTTALIIKSMPSILTNVADAGKWSFNQVGKLYRSCSAPEVGEEIEEVERMLRFPDDDFGGPMGYGSRNMGKLANSETETLELEGSTWTKAFNNTVGKVCEVIGVLAAVAFALISTVQFLEDLGSGVPLKTEVLDGIIMAANIGVAICAVIGLMSAGTLVPILGAVFAIIGIVAALIEMFWPSAPPPSPIEVLMKGHLVPAASGENRWILDAPDGWTIDKTVPARNAYNPVPKVAIA